MGFYASVEAAALAWDITAASLQRCRKLNFPEVSFSDLEQQLDALKCVISQAVPASHGLPVPALLPPPMQPQMLAEHDAAMMDPGQQHPDDGMHQQHMHGQLDTMHEHQGMHAHGDMHPQQPDMHQGEGAAERPRPFRR
jgi:hypothetical protein